MSVMLLGVGEVLLALPCLLRRVGRSAGSAAWARWCLHATWLGAVNLLAGLATMAIPATLRATGAPALAAACERALTPWRPGGVIGSWIAAGLALWIAGALVVGTRQARHAQRDAVVDRCVGDHRDLDGIDVVVVPAAEPLAFSVRGRSPQIVLTSGLIDALSHDELDAVVRHERAHLRANHQRYLTIAVAVETALGPLARGATSELRLAIERSADETAACADPQRRSVLRAALLASTTQTRLSLATLSPVALIEQRVAALETEPPPPSLHSRLALHTSAAAVMGAAAGALSLWAQHITHVIAMLGRCLR